MKSSRHQIVSLLNVSCFLVLVVTGLLAFARPFSIRVVGLHALMGFVFVGLIAIHLVNNTVSLRRYLKSRALWGTLGITFGLTAVFLWQPEPIRRVLQLSQNLGPALDRFEVSDEGVTYRYSPSPRYKMTLNIRSGIEFDSETPPLLAIWLENASLYHIKTLHEPPERELARKALPYWDFKLRGWEEAKRQASESGEALGEQMQVDAVSGATKNSSFDPADYILPVDSKSPLSYRLLVEIEQPGDDQPSLVYAVEVDNGDARSYQLLELMGYPKRSEGEETGKEIWELYYVDERFSSALELIDSALLTIDRDD